jgi:hypothetical protein
MLCSAAVGRSLWLGRTSGATKEEGNTRRQSPPAPCYRQYPLGQCRGPHNTVRKGPRGVKAGREHGTCRIDLTDPSELPGTPL